MGQGFDLWSGKIPHVVEQLSPCTTTAEPVLWSPGATTAEAQAPWSPRSTREDTATRSHTMQLESSPHSLQLEKSPHNHEDPVQPKIKDNHASHIKEN